MLDASTWGSSFSASYPEPDLGYVQAVDAGRWAVAVGREVVGCDAAVVAMVAVGAFAAGSPHGFLHTMVRQLAEAPIHTGLTSVAAVRVKLVQP